MGAELKVVKAPGMVPDELKHEPRSKGIATAEEETERTCCHHRMLHRLRWLARVRRILSRRRLHVLGP